MDWAAGYTSTIRVMRVNPETWEDSGELPGVTSASITRDSTSELVESCTVEADGVPGAELGNGWHRIEMIARQGGEIEMHPIGTFLLSRGSGDVDRGADRLSIDGESVLKPAADRLMLAGSYAPKGADGAAWAAGILGQCTPAPVVADGSFTLDAHVVFGTGTSCLKAALAVLGAAGWTVSIDGDGTVHVRKPPEEPALDLDWAHAGHLQPGIRHAVVGSGIPNRYYAVEGRNAAVAVNDDPESPTGVLSQGRYVDVYDGSPKRVDGETLQAYAERRLSELSIIETEYSYSRELWPGVVPGSMVRASMPQLGFEGDLRVVKQSVACDKGVSINETAVKREVTYGQA